MGFSEIEGQDKAINIIKRAISSGHIAQTYLFHGPEGVGKKMTAINFAKALNCHDYRDDVCEVCISCRKIGQGIHPDVMLVTTEKGEIKIGVIRDIISGMAYHPLEAEKRVIIIDEADKFNLSSSNAFLKTLEEPPLDTVIILVSASPEMLPSTVLSRSHKILFGTIPAPAIIEILVTRLGTSRDNAEYAAYLANGSITRAVSLSSADAKKVREDVLSIFSGTGRYPGAFDLSEKYSKEENNFYDTLYWTYTYFRDVLILKSRCNSNLIINKDMQENILKTKERMTVERLLYIMDFIKSIYKGQERNMNRQLALDTTISKIMEVNGSPL